MFFNRDGEATTVIKNVSDFDIAGDGTLVVAREDTQGNAVISTFTGDYTTVGGDIEVEEVREYASYDLLPTFLTVDSAGTQAAYVLNQHLYVLPLEPDSDHVQATDSNLEERMPEFSPDGSLIAFNDSFSCGNVTIIQNDANTFPVRIETLGPDAPNDGDFPYYPGISVCGNNLQWR